MARSREEIRNRITSILMLDEFFISVYGLDPNVSFDEQFSIASFENRLIIAITFILWTLETIFDTHKSEVDNLIRTQKTHKAPWVRNMLLNFQYGFDLLPETDLFDNEGYNEDQIAASKIIKYAAVTESDDEKRLICKIATETGGELSPLTATQIDAVKAWIKEIKAAGIPYTIINYLPDLLQLNIRIFRDPLVLDSTGVHRINGNKPVEDALREFMRELPFNGEFRIQDLVDKLQKTDGVNIAEVDSALSSWIDAQTNNYGVFTLIDVKRIAVSGYFKIQNFDGITYVV